MPKRWLKSEWNGGSRLAAAVVVLAMAAPLCAHNPIEGEFTCPICHKGFMDVFLGPWPFYASFGGLGMGPELRNWSYMGPGTYWVMGCPHCGYCNTIGGFHLVYLDTVVVRQDPNAGPPAENGEAKQVRRSYVRLHPAKPLDYPAIRAKLRESVDPAEFRYVNAYIPERIEIMLRTVPGWTAREQLRLAMNGAWACDDAGETKRGLDFRATAIKAGQQIIKSFPPDMSPWERIATRYQVAEMQLTVGRGRGDANLRAAGRAAMRQLLDDLPGIQKQVERQADEIEAPIKDLRRRIRKELTADAMRDRPFEEALAAARNGTPIEREAFLMAHGARFDRPPMLGFVRELLGPLYVSGAGGIFGEKQPPQFQRYITAIAQAHNRQREDFFEGLVVQRVLTEKLECDLPNPIPAKGKPEGKGGRQREISVKLTPANAGTIRKALAAADDGEPETSLFWRDDDAASCIEELCVVDARWMAEVILEDLPRHPRAYLGIYFGQWKFGGLGFEDRQLPSECRKTRPGRLIARHLPEQARRGARSALGDLAREKISPSQAAASLIPLHFLDDKESLAVLRLAARSGQTVVRRTATAAMLHRGVPEAVDALLEDALAQKRLGELPAEAISLLDRQDMPALRKLLRLAPEAAGDEPNDANAPEDEYPVAVGDSIANRYWLLAGLAHLGDDDALRQYDAYALRVRTKVGDPAGPETKEGARLHHTPVTARCADLNFMLYLAERCYCTEAMARKLLDGVKLLPHWFTQADRDLLRALAGNEKTHGHYRKLAANLADRPIPLWTKTELMRHAERIPVPEVTEAVRRWASSGHAELAREAREALRRMER